MKKIPLGSHSDIERYALVDDEDFERVNRYRWYASRDIQGLSYACRSIKTEDNKTAIVLMHRFIMNAEKGEIVEHKKRNGLDNRRKNLRACTSAQVQAGKKLGKNSQTGYKGISWIVKRGHYTARIGRDNKMIYLGSFDNPIDAARAYNEEAVKLYGEFAFENKF